MLALFSVVAKEIHKEPVEGGDGFCIQYLSELLTSFIPNDDHSLNKGQNVSSDALIYLNGYLYGGAGDEGTIFRIDPESMTVETQTTFLSSEVNYFEQLIYNDDDGYIYAMIKISGYNGNWIQKISIPSVGSGNPFQLVDSPLYAGSVVYGTDVNVYGSYITASMNAFWEPVFRPVTGAQWWTVWEQLPITYPYTILAGSGSLAGTYSSGAELINFQLLPNGELIFNSGPQSGTFPVTSLIHQFQQDGTRVRIFSGTTTIGPEEIVPNPSNGYDLALLRCTGATTNLTLRRINASSGASGDVLITGLELPDGTPLDGSIYHKRTRWHSNGRIYSMHSTYPNNYGRIIAVDPNGTLLYQYSYQPQNLFGSFVIAGDYVYVWQDSWHNSAGYVSSIIKLTLDLEFVCLYDAPAGWSVPLSLYTERGRHIVHDGVNKVYNFGTRFGSDGIITKYQVSGF